MKRRLVITCLGCLFLTGGFAQSSWKFRSVEYVGMVFGEDGNYGQFQTINGAYKGSWFLGAGLGLDYYRFRSLPLFLSVSKELMPARNGLFISLDGGTNFPLYNRPQYFYGGDNPSEFIAGPFWSAGLGYKIRLSAHRDHALSLLAGYSYKELKEDLTNDSPQNTRYDYRNRRWSLKIGLIL